MFKKKQCPGWAAVLTAALTILTGACDPPADLTTYTVPNIPADPLIDPVKPPAEEKHDKCRLILGLSCAEFNQAYVKSSRTMANHAFGHSIALSKNGDTLAVGAPQEYGVGSNSGAVYIFTRSGTAWEEQARITASNADTGDHFGYSLALSETGNILAVGAHLEDSGAKGVHTPGSGTAAGDDNSQVVSGAAYIFTRSDARWKQEAYIKASNTDRMDRFGFSIALSETGNTLAVGAPYERSNARGVYPTGTGTADPGADNTHPRRGAVYVFTRSASGAAFTWSQQAYIKASNSDSFDQFGRSVAISGSTLAVGAPDEDSNARGVYPTGTGTADPGADNTHRRSGAVYIFTQSHSGAAASWSQQAYIKASNSGESDKFGTSIALSGSTLAVGAPKEDSKAGGVHALDTGTADPGADNTMGESGAVYLFTRSLGSVWRQQAYIKASNPAKGDYFGFSAALSDTGETLAIGARLEDSGAKGIDGDETDKSMISSGAVYLFTRSPGSLWGQKAYIKASNTDEDDYFGSSLALSGSILAVGAVREDSISKGIGGNEDDNSAPESGAVYVRRIKP